MSFLTMAVRDDLVDLVAKHEDPADAWAALQNHFQASNKSQVLLLYSILHTMRMTEGGFVEDYLRNAWK